MFKPFDFTILQPPVFMGVINITPNSFSDTGAYLSPSAAVDHARALANAGAQILDLGAEASSFFRPGVAPVPADEQLGRLRPVMSAITGMPQTYISIDTRSAVVAREVLQSGAHIINDISAGTYDQALFDTIAAAPNGGGAVILMHIGPSWPDNPKSDQPDILQTVRDFLEKRVNAALKAGIPQDKIAIDPGLGFAKTPYDNWTLALRPQELQSLGVPVVLGASRKRFLETEPPPHLAPGWHKLLAHFSSGYFTHPRDSATAALTHLAIKNGVLIHRIHNVGLSQFIAQ